MDKQNKKENNSEPAPRKPDQEGGWKRPLIVWMLLAAVILSIFGAFSQTERGAQENQTELTWAELNVYIARGELKSCELTQETGSGVGLLTGTLDDEKKTPFRVVVSASDNAAQRLGEKGVACTLVPKTDYLGPILINILPIVVVMFLVYFFFFRGMKGGGAMNFGKSRAKMLNQDNKKVNFSDVAGVEEAKEEVSEIVEFLKNPKKFEKLGGQIPKGVLLLGPPGTGKTLLAKAIAGEADVPFFSISGSDFVEMFVGVGASRVRDMFEQGKKNAPCIIFIDEIDAVGRSRFTGIGGGHDEREQTLNAMLVEMDGFDSNEGVIIIAATNRADVLDAALTRPGRFDRQIVVDLPTVDGRLEILKIHAKKLKLSPAVDLMRIARGTPGFSGADLANLLNEGALLAARLNREEVEHIDLEEARDKVLWGRERKSRTMADRERRITAWHEAGHALTQVLCRHAEPLHKVTIIPRGMALGATMSLPERDVLNRTKSEMKDMLVVMCGGRIAEKLFAGDISTGASQDIRMASDLARRMVCTYGMSDGFGFQAFGQNQDTVFLGRDVARQQEHSEATLNAIDAEIGQLLHEAYARCENMILDHRAKLEELVELLLREETVDGRDVEDLIRLGRVRTAEERLAERREKGELPEEPVEKAVEADAAPVDETT